MPSALRRLTEIATENSGAQCACVVIAREAGDYTVATRYNCFGQAVRYVVTVSLKHVSSKTLPST